MYTCFRLAASTTIAVTLYISACFVAPADATAEDVVDAVSQLEFLASEMEGNYQKINTWQATYKLMDRYLVSEEWVTKLKPNLSGPVSGTGPWQRRDFGVVTFKFDRDIGSVFTALEMTGGAIVRDAEGNEMDVKVSGLAGQQSIITDNRYLFFHPDEKYGEFEVLPGMKNIFGRAAFRDFTEKAEDERYSMIVDPRHLFAYKDPLWDELRKFSQLLKHYSEVAPAKIGKHRIVTVSRASDGTDLPKYIIVVKLLPNKDAAPEKAATVQITCDAKFGHCATSAEMTGPKGRDMQSMTWEYKEQDGIFVPAKIVHTTATPDGTHISAQRTLQLQDSVTNDPIDPKAFTVSEFDLKEGERFIDRVEEVCYVVRAGNLVEASKFYDERSEAVLPPEKAKSGRTFVLFGVNAVVLLVIAGLLIIRRRKSTRK